MVANFSRVRRSKLALSRGPRVEDAFSLLGNHSPSLRKLFTPAFGTTADIVYFFLHLLALGWIVRGKWPQAGQDVVCT